MSAADKKAPIRVCFIAPKAYPLFKPQIKEVVGGAEVDMYFLATELAKDKEFAVSFLVADYGQPETETIEGVRIIKTLDFKESSLAGAIKVWKGLRKMDAQIYFQEAASWGTFLVALFCRLHKRTFIYRTAHEYECDGTYLKQHYFAGRAFRWSLRNTAKTIVQNEIDKENIQRTIGVYSTVLPNAHRLPVLPTFQRDIILWVGRSAQFKRPELFIQLAEQIPDEQFTMICQRATGDKKYEELLASASRVKNLRFIKQVPFCEIDSYYRRAKVFVSTSESEGFPNTFIEACNYAVPILSLKVDPDGFINRYNCGITCDGDWKRLVDSLKIMLQEQRNLEFGKNGRAYVEKHHDLAEIVKQYKHLFIELLRSLR